MNTKTHVLMQHPTDPEQTWECPLRYADRAREQGWTPVDSASPQTPVDPNAGRRGSITPPNPANPADDIK